MAEIVPLICAHPCSVGSAAIFNPNCWSGQSRSLVWSCWNQYSVLHYCIDQISDLCANSGQLCHNQITELQKQWQLKQFPLDKMIYFAQQPDIHIRIESFLSGTKSLLDLLVQLLSTEGIVGTPINGFHRDKTEYGGRVLNALKGNAVKAKEDKAVKIIELILTHKRLWIDQVIQARDLLVHPKKGTSQLMFRLELIEKNGALLCQKVHSPEICSTAIDHYAQETRNRATEFSSKFLGLLVNAA